MFAIKLVGEPLDGDGLDEWVGDDDFVAAEGSGITVVGCLDIGLEDFAQAGNAA